MDFLTGHVSFLDSSQNADGGWGYFPGKQSWLEPTVYAALALAGDTASAGQVQRAWGLVRSWQNPDGGWRPCAAVAQSSWVTALAVTLADVLGERGSIVHQGARWLMASAGAESSTLNRVLRFLGVSAIEREVSDAGWPWNPGTSAWVEPTVHSLMALKKLNHHKPDRAVSGRILEGERMLLQVRCAGGGWNYGSPRAIGIDLPAYAENSALALIGLGERAPVESFKRARLALEAKDTSPMGRAWLRIALGVDRNQTAPWAGSRDIVLCAIQALDGNLLHPGVRA